MRRLVQFTLQQRVVFNLLFVLLMVIGAFALLKMPVERYPNIQFGKMYINTFLPGASPDEVESLVTRVIEEALEDLDDVEYVRSASFRERSNIVIKFVDDSDYERRFDDVRLKVLSMAGELPDNVEPPVFNFLDVGDWFPTISVNVAGDHSNTTLTLVAEEVKLLLLQIPGVREVQLTGEFTREFHLVLSKRKLELYTMTFGQVAESLRLRNVSYPGGVGKTREGDFVLRVDEQLRDRGQLLDTILRVDGDGSFVRLGDLVSSADFDYRDPFIVASVDGKDCVTLRVLKHTSGNTLFISRHAREVVKQIRQLYKDDGIELKVTQDSSTRIADSTRVLGVNLLLGVTLVCCIIWLFMGFRNAALTTIGIPFAFLVTLTLMYITGNSVNEVSLFAFVLVSGIIVDDAIVVVENIYRHRQEGKPVAEAVVSGTSEVFLPVFSATLTTVVAFLPMLIMTGMVGDFFEIIPKTIAFALIASLFECLFVLPCHYLDFGPKRVVAVAGHLDRRDAEKEIHDIYHRERWVMRTVRRGFHRCILFALRFRRSCIGLLGLLFIASLVIFITAVEGKNNLVRIKFFPDDYSSYYVEIIGPNGTPVMQTHELIKKLSQNLVKNGPSQVASALGFAGYYITEDFSPKYGTNLGYVAVTLPGVADRKFSDFPKNDVVQHLQNVRTRLQPLVPEGYSLSIRPEKDGPPTGKDLNIRILGKDAENVGRLAGTLRRYLQEDPIISPWLKDLRDDQGRPARIYQIRIDQEKVAEHGLTMKQVAGLAAASQEGAIVGEMKLPEERVDIRLKRDRDPSVIPARGLDLDMVVSRSGDAVVRLRDVCTPEYHNEPGTLNRFQNRRAITLTANLIPGSELSAVMVVDKVSRYYNEIRADYPGATLNFAGEYESTRKSFTSLAYAFVIAIVVIYLILAAQFQSYLQPMIVIAAVIFALTGVILGTVFSRTLFTVNSFVALIGVTGVVVNDSLVLVEFINRTSRTGIARSRALLLATHIRLRPILLTTLTTTLGLLPMALGIPEYSTIWGSMAMTFVTGLCTATFLTIIIIPLLWDMVTGRGQ